MLQWNINLLLLDNFRLLNLKIFASNQPSALAFAKSEAVNKVKDSEEFHK